MYIACFCGLVFEALDEDWCPNCGAPQLDPQTEKRYGEMRAELHSFLDTLESPPS